MLLVIQIKTDLSRLVVVASSSSLASTVVLVLTR